MREARRPFLRAVRAVEAACPAVRARQALSLLAPGLVGREDRESAEPLPFGRRRFEPPRQRGERPAHRPTRDVLGSKELGYLLPERAGLPRAALVRCRLPYEVETLRRPRAGRVEEVAIAGDGVGAAQARPEAPPLVVVDERRRRRAPRKAPLFEAEDEDVLEAAGACSHEVEHRNPAGVGGARLAHHCALEGGEDVLARDRLGEALPALELGEHAAAPFVGTEVVAGVLVGRRALQAVGGPQHADRELTNRLDRRGGRAERVERRETRFAECLELLLDPLGPRDRAAAQPALDEVHAAAPEPGVGRPQVPEELAPVGRRRPGKPEQGQHRLSVPGLAEAERRVDGVRDAERAKRSLDRAPPALERRDDDADLRGRGTATQKRKHLLADELERASGPGTLEEADGAFDRRRLISLVRRRAHARRRRAPGERPRRTAG